MRLSPLCQADVRPAGALSARTLVVAASMATVASTDSPRAPPSCWPVFSGRSRAFLKFVDPAVDAITFASH